MSLKTGHAVAVVQVEEQASYVLQLRFNDGHASTVDFGPFLRRSRNPQTRQFLDRKLFNTYKLCDGNLVWGDYDMCFAIENLYVGEVDTRATISTQTLAVAEPRAVYSVKANRKSVAS